MSVVIADSHTLLCESLAAYLKGQGGIRFIGSCNSVGAVRDLVDSTHPDVLLMDSDLLADVGLGFIRTITRKPGAPAVVLLMTREDREAAALAMRTGVSACVLKQGSLDDLLAATRAIAAGQMWMSPALLTALFAECRADPSQVRAREQLRRLTPREMDVLRLMVAGRDRGAIADALYISSNTVRTHVQNIETKLDVHSVVAAVSVALQAGVRPD